MNILMLNYEFPPLGGGASPVSYEIAKGYAQYGHKVDVVTMSYRGLQKHEVMDGINIYRVPSWRRKQELCHSWEMLTYIVSAKKFLKQHLQNQFYDINHTHFIVPTGIVAEWVKKKFKIPYIVTAHGSDVPGFNTDRFKFLHFFTRPWLKSVCKNANLIVSPSIYLKGLIKGKIGDIKVKVIPNGIYTGGVKPGVKQKIVLSTGRLLPRKGFHYLIKAVSERDAGYEVHIAGDGPMMGYLQKMARISETKIVLHGWLDSSSETYRNLLEAASIFVLASEKENASVALLEAMSAGCAVITTNDSGCREMVGDAGLIVEPRNAEQIKHRIDLLIRNREQMEELQKKSRRRVLAYYDWQAIIKEYCRVLK